MSPSDLPPSTCPLRSAPRTSLTSLLLLGLLMLLLTTGCGAQPTQASSQTPTAPPTATPAPAATAVPTIAPERLELGRTLLVTQGCVGCHTITGIPAALGVIGPNLSHIASDATQIIESPDYKGSGGAATTVEAFLRESIVDPSRFVASTCPLGACTDNVMPKTFNTQLKEDEITALVDLLLTLK